MDGSRPGRPRERSADTASASSSCVLPSEERITDTISESSCDIGVITVLAGQRDAAESNVLHLLRNCTCHHAAVA
jgi:hypothetical protein